MKAKREVVHDGRYGSIVKPPIWRGKARKFQYSIGRNERLVLESGPDPVELLRKVFAVLEGQGYIMPQTYQEIRDYLAALEEK